MKVLQKGIVDFIVKDDLEDQLPVIMRRAELIRQGRIEQLILRWDSHIQTEERKLVYQSEIMRKLIERLEALAIDDISVLISGEAGTGKR